MKARSVFQHSLLTVLSLGLFVGLLDPLPLHASPTTIAAFTYDPCVPCVPPGDLVVLKGLFSVQMRLDDTESQTLRVLRGEF